MNLLYALPYTSSAIIGTTVNNLAFMPDIKPALLSDVIAAGEWLCGGISLSEPNIEDLSLIFMRDFKIRGECLNGNTYVGSVGKIPSFLLECLPLHSFKDYPCDFAARSGDFHMRLLFNPAVKIKGMAPMIWRSSVSYLMGRPSTSRLMTDLSQGDRDHSILMKLGFLPAGTVGDEPKQEYYILAKSV